jgi:hypothetical protein
VIPRFELKLIVGLVFYSVLTPSVGWVFLIYQTLWLTGEVKKRPAPCNVGYFGVLVENPKTGPKSRRQVMKKSCMFIGLDIHKDSIEIAIAESGRDGEVGSYGGID